MYFVKKNIIITNVNVLIVLLFYLLQFSDLTAQHRFKTVRDKSKYTENSIDVKIFRTFNNIESKFVHTLIGITNRSIVPASIGTPAGLFTISRINKNHYDESSAVLLALSEITNEAFTQALKYSVRRNRPYRTLNGVNLSDTSSVSGTYSFPSGHSSGSFVIATLLTLRYPDKPVLISGLYTWATIVSLGRMYWGVHYPSDVFTGMLVGAGSAALIYSLRKPIIKAKNNFFNQSERTESSSTDINSTALLLSFVASDIINFYFSNSGNKILKKSKLNFSTTSKINSLNYTLNF